VVYYNVVTKGGSGMRAIVGSLILLMAALMLTVTGCVPAETGPGTIDVVATSNLVKEGAPDAEAEIEITNIRAVVSEIKVYRGGVIQEVESQQGEWVELYVASRPLDLLQNSSQEQFLAFADVAASSYDEIIMVVERINVGLSNGFNLSITPDEPFNFEASFVVFSAKTTTIIFKFNIDKSVTINNDDQVIIQPLAGITLNVRQEDTGM
jgi:hypothetical protein